MSEHNINNMTFGWHPDLPDFRDYTPEHKEIKPLLKSVKSSTNSLPYKVDFRKYCSPIENQGNIGSCTANAVANLVEYMENRSHGNYINGSRLFLYKVTRNLLGFKGDTGAYLRSTIGALKLFGLPPEKYWPYVEDQYDVEPSPFVYSLAQNFQSIKYVRLDDPHKLVTITKILDYIAKGFLVVGGFVVFSSIERLIDGCIIPVPNRRDRVLGGHAVFVVGYNRKLKIPGANTYGAFLIKNSWGTNWGMNGYGWLPFQYYRWGLFRDLWTITSQEYVETKEFGF